MFWQDSAQAKAVVRRGGPGVDVNMVTRNIASYAIWLAQDSAESGPHIRFLIDAIEEGAITIRRA
jgi:hypothetical protein